MTGLENRLRAALRDTAGEIPADPPPLRLTPERPRRRWLLWAAPLTAAAVVVAVVFGSLATNFPPGGDMNGPENGDTYVRGPFGSGSSLQARAGNIIGGSNDSGTSGSPQQPSTCRGLSSWDRYLPRLPAGAEATCAA